MIKNLGVGEIFLNTVDRIAKPQAMTLRQWTLP